VLPGHHRIHALNVIIRPGERELFRMRSEVTGEEPSRQQLFINTSCDMLLHGVPYSSTMRSFIKLPALSKTPTAVVCLVALILMVTCNLCGWKHGRKRRKI
jgi:hypothetical protein